LNWTKKTQVADGQNKNMIAELKRNYYKNVKNSKKILKDKRVEKRFQV